MEIIDIINRILDFNSINEGGKIPWNEPQFSQRMLAYHLSQDHDWASRRQDYINKHVACLAKNIKAGGSLLDLACGPGFYTQALAALGYKCSGVDFSPASIEYAKKKAKDDGLDINYILEDIRRYKGEAESFDCIIFVFGEFNVFSETDAKAILMDCAKMLKKGGILLVEGHSFEAVHESGVAPASWWTSEQGAGVLSDKPHVCLQENFWDENSLTALSRYYIIAAETKEVESFSSSMKAYTFSDYEQMFKEAGFTNLQVLNDDQWPTGDPFKGLMNSIMAYKL